MSASDMTSIAQAAHKLKGAASNYGLDEISGPAAAMEEAAEESQDFDYKGNYAKVKAGFQALEAAVAKLG